MARDAEPQWQDGGRVEPPTASGASGRSPLEVDAFVEANPAGARWVLQATAWFVVLGVLLRVVRYLLKFPLWCDESMLAANFLDRGYADLFRPLGYRQVAPLLFLLVEYSSIKLLGFSELTLRLVPVVCGGGRAPAVR